jgi:hypothetical protein
VPRARPLVACGQLAAGDPLGVRSGLSADPDLRSGRVHEDPGGQKDFGRFEFVSRDQNQEIMTHLTIRLSGAPPGSYVFGATYRDQISGKSASLELPFRDQVRRTPPLPHVGCRRLAGTRNGPPVLRA